MLDLPGRLPPVISIEVCRRCNFACPFCSCIWEEDPHSVGEELSTAAWKGILAALSGRGVTRVDFTGGEPLLRPDIWELLAFARETFPGRFLGLFTNASLLDEAGLLTCKRLGVSLSTSLQGWETRSAMTGTDFPGRETLRAILRAAELEWPMAVGLTATAANAGEIPKMMVMAARAGARQLMVHPMMFEGRARQHPELRLSQAAWDDLRARCVHVDVGETPVAFGSELECACRACGGRVKGCRAGRDFGAIGPSGVYRPCLHWQGQWVDSIGTRSA